MNIYDIIKLSLDKDLAEKMTTDTASLIVLTQVLRIMRGRPFKIDLNAPQSYTTGWSPDGVHWFPSEPGTSTTGNGPIPPLDK